MTSLFGSLSRTGKAGVLIVSEVTEASLENSSGRIVASACSSFRVAEENCLVPTIPVLTTMKTCGLRPITGNRRFRDSHLLRTRNKDINISQRFYPLDKKKRR